MKRLLPLLLASCAQGPSTSPLERVAVDGTRFVLKPSGRPFTPWGFNYDHDAKSRLLEDYWEGEGDVVAEDFREMKALGASIVRIHLQFAKFMEAPDRPDPAALKRLRWLLELAEEVGLHLDLTGLGSYRKADAPAWYVDAPEAERWAMQARFWEAVAAVGAGSRAVAYYSLMNEPISPPAPSKELWGGELGGFQYVERLTRDPAGRERHQITRAWMDGLIAAIRKHDREALVTAGTFFLFEVPGGLTLGPDPVKLAAPLDFVAVHLYPKTGKVKETLDLLKVLKAAGKPIVIQEMFALNCGLPDFQAFLEGSRAHAAGWISFYWGRTAAEYRKDGDLKGGMMAAWLDFIQGQAP